MAKISKRIISDEQENRLFVTLELVLAIIACYFVCRATRYHFVDSEFPFWIVALVVGVISSIALAGLLLRKESDVWQFFGKLFLLILLLFLLIQAALCNLNHAFDKGEAIRYYVEIEEKYYNTSRRAPNTYKFRVTVDEYTFNIVVPLSDYNSHDVGDSYVIEYHEGALGEPYYIAVGPVP